MKNVYCEGASLEEENHPIRQSGSHAREDGLFHVPHDVRRADACVTSAYVSERRCVQRGRDHRVACCCALVRGDIYVFESPGHSGSRERAGSVMALVFVWIERSWRKVKGGMGVRTSAPVLRDGPVPVAAHRFRCSIAAPALCRFLIVAGRFTTPQDGPDCRTLCSM